MDFTTASQHRRTYFSKLKNKKILSVSVFMVLFSIGSAQLPPRCCDVCDCRSNAIWCQLKGLNSVPREIPTNTKRLYLFRNNISVIPTRAFAALTNLEILDLRTNNLDNRGIAEGAFDGLTNLQALMLSENKLTTLTTNILSGTVKLVRLYLKDNLIENIEDDALTNLTKLVELKLGNNRLTDVPRFVNCRGLRRLYLNNNRITALPSQLFASISDLEDLTLAHNQLQEIPSDLFGKTSSLRIFDISSNKLRSGPQIIRNMTSLQTLNLSGNLITSLPRNFLQKLRKIKTLDLRGLRLTALPQGFIPRSMFLNIFDASDNPWHCNCDIQWMVEYMKEFKDVFTSIKNVQCKKPQHLRGRTLTSLSSNDRYCERASIPSTTLRAKTKPTARLQTTIPSIDLCDLQQCKNGGTCYINLTSHVPVCRCPPGWAGVHCTKALGTPKPPSTTRASATTPNETKSKPKLMISRPSLTPHSVDIFFPIIKKRMTITTTITRANGRPVQQTSSKTIFPTKHSYKVEGLEAGRTYNICICVTDRVYTTSRGKAVEDKLCNIVTTPSDALAEQKDDSIRATKQNTSKIDPTIKRSNNLMPVDASNDQKNQKDSAIVEESRLPIYIAIAIGATLVIIVVSLVIFCKRRKKPKTRKTTNNNHTNGMPLRPNRSDFDNIKPTALTQHSSRGGEQIPAVVPLLHHNSDYYEGRGKHSCASCSATTQRIATPNQTESLGRSSTSDGSVFCGAQSKSERCCSQGSGGRYPTSMDGVRHNAIHKNVALNANYRPPLNNREYGSIHRSQGSPSLQVAENDFHEVNGPIGVVPVLSTTTSVNHSYHGTIATTAFNQQTGCFYPMQNGLHSTSINGCPPEVARTRQVSTSHAPIKQPPYRDTTDFQYDDDLYDANNLLRNQVNRTFIKTLAV